PTATATASTRTRTTSPAGTSRGAASGGVASPGGRAPRATARAGAAPPPPGAPAPGRTRRWGWAARARPTPPSPTSTTRPGRGGDDVYIAPEDVLLFGDPTNSEAFKTLIGHINHERCGNASMCIGAAQGALEYAIGYINERTVGGRPLAELQGLQWKVADMGI